MAVVRPNGTVERLHRKRNVPSSVGKAEGRGVSTLKSVGTAKEIIECAVFLNDYNHVLYLAAGSAPDWDWNERRAVTATAQAR
jgi:hypothetical protein